ncbi:MAG: carbamoyl-phosphate synthase (glutamine-hydrolyzing) large subunit [Patescibacteria group bacterium]
MKNKPKKVLLLGSGGLKIGQAGEFDYSGSQAIKALQEEGVKVILMNPNIATVQTDEKFADGVYFLPLTDYFATEIIKKERPDAILLSFGGQTALNLGLALERQGVLKKYNVKVLGTPVSTIRDTEDRDLFIKRLSEIEVKTARSYAATTVVQAKKAARSLGYPVMVRSAFSLGGEGSGKINSEKELVEKLETVLQTVPQVLVEEYLLGWKEVEYEVVRDQFDNCITVCNMENIDPMGVHTGESMVVAPSQTLSNEEYHHLREVAIKTIRHLGIVGECNIQYALNPKNGDYRVIEVNARLSRSSALASKATGYPLAFVAAKLALGYALTDIKNAVTGTTTACFEPALDYIVLKMPRWDVAKFQGAPAGIGSEMKSVGEVMAIGRSFEEVFQKAIRMTAIGAHGFTANPPGNFSIKNYTKELKNPTTRRVFALAEALRRGASVSSIHKATGITSWFLEKMQNIIVVEKEVKNAKTLTAPLLRRAKQAGFSDIQIALLRGSSEDAVRATRKKAGVVPVVKQIDTLAGEFPSDTNYLYLTYHGVENDIQRGKQSVAVLGSGPYCIGSSVEFDWSSVQAVKALARAGKETIIINYNPETVSTDYDMSDRLYFEELSLERVLDIVDFEKPEGVIVSMGGQIPNNLALPLKKHGVPILGTDPDNIHRAESRHLFSDLLDTLGIEQPQWAELTTVSRAVEKASAMGYPVLVRPSYVLSGAAMNIALHEGQLIKFLERASVVSSEHPVVISKFIENVREIEIDGVAQRGNLNIYAISEHVENAGTHSGDATIVLPPQHTYLETVRRAKNITRAVIKELNITGPFNIQFLAKDNQLQVIELNIRASRSFPFVSKVTGHNFIDIATRLMLGEKIPERYQTVDLPYVAVKSPQFSYNRIKGVDPLGYVEMASTGEVACFGDTYDEALLKSMMAVGFRLPKKGIFVSIGRDDNKIKLLPELKQLHKLGLPIHATPGTAEFLKEHGVKSQIVHKLQSGRHPNVSDLFSKRAVDLIINIPTRAYSRSGATTKQMKDGYTVRRRAVDLGIPLITNLQLAEAFLAALFRLGKDELHVKRWDEYLDRI